jgi:multisubunit Na+/H+ antiporter MnhB subunit
MRIKKNPANLIKGWLPRETRMPTQALHQSTLKTEVAPLFTGLGVGLVVLGLSFCFFSSYYIEGKLPVEVVINVISHYLVSIAVGCAFLGLGVVLIVFGIKKSQNPNAKISFYSKRVRQFAKELRA